MKTSAKLTAIKDIKMDPEFQRKQKENALNGMGVVRPGIYKFEQLISKRKKQSAS